MTNRLGNPGHELGVAPRRRLIAASAALYAVMVVLTTVYFVPELIAFAGSQESGIPASE